MRVKTEAELLASGWVRDEDDYFTHPQCPVIFNRGMLEYSGRILIKLGDASHRDCFHASNIGDEPYRWSWHPLMLSSGPKYKRNLPDWF